MTRLNIDRLFKVKTPMSVNVDEQARAVYFTISEQGIQRTERVNSFVSIDYGNDGSILGIEIIRI